MRKGLVVGVIIGFVLGIPAAVLAGYGRGDGPMNRQRFAFQNHAITKSSTSFSTIGNLSVADCSVGPVAVTLSGNVGGAPAAFRISVDGGAKFMEPGSPQVKAVEGGTNAFSYTFVTQVNSFEDNDFHTFQVQWRSVNGGAVTLYRAATVMQHQDPGSCAG